MSKADAAQVEGAYHLVQQSGETREITVEYYGTRLEITALDTDEESSNQKRLTPHQAWMLCDVTDSMIEKGAILDDNGFIQAVRDWVRDNTEAMPDV